MFNRFDTIPGVVSSASQPRCVASTALNYYIAVARVKRRSGGAEDGKTALCCMHEQLLHQWIFVQHFQVLLAITQKLQYFKFNVTLIYLLYLLPVVMLQCQQSRRMQINHRQRCIRIHHS